MSEEVKTQTQTPQEVETVEKEQPKQESPEEKYKPGQVFKMDELPDEMEEDEYGQLDQELLQKYEKTFERVKEGDIIKGTIVAVTPKDVVVDVGFKSEGM
ncbi:MAG: hypothetical protein WAN36_07025, partial [Calditrichia bacterium]